MSISESLQKAYSVLYNDKLVYLEDRMQIGLKIELNSEYLAFAVAIILNNSFASTKYAFVYERPHTFLLLFSNDSSEEEGDHIKSKVVSERHAITKIFLKNLHNNWKERDIAIFKEYSPVKELIENVKDLKYYELVLKDSQRVKVLIRIFLDILDINTKQAMVPNRDFTKIDLLCREEEYRKLLTFINSICLEFKFFNISTFPKN